jgi:hypothetical protein
MSATTTSGGAKPHVIPSFYAGGGFEQITRSMEIS